MALRCCTSKITKHEDLETLATYGFRGEALHSLSSLGQVTVTTATKGLFVSSYLHGRFAHIIVDDEVRTVYSLDSNGNIASSRHVASCGPGTVICVQELFASVPVRRRQYEKPDARKAEVKAIQDMLFAYALAHPDVRFNLRCGPAPAVVWSKGRSDDQRSAVAEMFGPIVAGDLVSVDVQEGDLRIHGLLPSPAANSRNVTRSDNDRCFTFVNKRPVVMKAVQKLVRHVGCFNAGDGDTSSKSRYPFIVLSLDISPSAYDVNLEPDKTSVLFNDEAALFALVSRLVAETYPARTDKLSQTPQRASPSASQPHTTSQETAKIPSSQATMRVIPASQSHVESNLAAVEASREQADDVVMTPLMPRLVLEPPPPSLPVQHMHARHVPASALRPRSPVLPTAIDTAADVPANTINTDPLQMRIAVSAPAAKPANMAPQPVTPPRSAETSPSK